MGAGPRRVAEPTADPDGDVSAARTADQDGQVLSARFSPPS